MSKPSHLAVVRLCCVCCISSVVAAVPACTAEPGAAPAPAITIAALGEVDQPYPLAAPDTLPGFSAAAGVDRWVRITVPPAHDGLRIAVRAGVDCDAAVYADPFAGALVASPPDRVHTFFFAPGDVTPGDDWWVRVTAVDATTIDVQADLVYARTLAWDEGATLAGLDAVSRPAGAFGDHLFHVTTQTPTWGLWRNVLRVANGEADLAIALDSVPDPSTPTASRDPGSDAYPMPGTAFQPGQTWTLRVFDESGAADWSLVSGDLYVDDFGPLGDAPAPRTLDLDVGIGWFTTRATAATAAWRISTSDPSAHLYIDDTVAPLVRDDLTTSDHDDVGEALVVPPYVDVQSYLVAVVATGDSVVVDSRNHLVVDPLTVPGASGNAFAFQLDDGDATSFGWRTYRVTVPVEQIGWEIKVASAGEVDLYVAQDQVPNAWNNGALSEVVGAAQESLSLVQPTLTNGTFYVSVHGKAAFTLTSGDHDIPAVPFVNDPDVIVNDAAHVAQTGWRYYVADNAEPPLGTLGWILELEEHAPGTALAVKQNGLPSRWDRRVQGVLQHVEEHDQYSALGFLERPNHQTDVWYIGVYHPSAALGAFHLRTRAMGATDLDFDGGSLTVTQASGRLRYYRVEVPTDAQGWDLRLNGVSGAPRLVVRAEQLPEQFTDSTVSDFAAVAWPLNQMWPNGQTWAPRIDLTNRAATYIDPSTTLDESGRFLLAGKNNPLRPGFFYVLVSDAYTPATPGATVSYTIDSRGVGFGSQWELPIADLDFAGGVASADGLAPRELRFYRVVVPEGAASWHVSLDASVGDAMMAIKKGSIPNLAAGISASSDLAVTGTRRQRGGHDLFYRYPDDGDTTLDAGIWYIAVGAEGDAPPATSYVTGGTTDFTLTSYGEAPVEDHDLELDVPTTLAAQTLRFAEETTYRVATPPGTTSLEVHVTPTSGTPYVVVVDGANQPQIGYPFAYPASEGGQTPIDSDGEVLTIPADAGATYSITVVAAPHPQTAAQDGAEYAITIVARSEAVLEFNGGAAIAIEQESETWRYFRVEVPDDALGWYLSLDNVVGGHPRMVVRRDAEPDPAETTTTYGLQGWDHWPSEAQWVASGELTQRTDDPGASPGSTVSRYGQHLSVGMGSPLEPGTYYIGVRDAGTGTSSTYSYELVSRGIGQGDEASDGDAWDLQVVDLDFDDLGGGSAGGNADTQTLAPRAHAYYRVTVPTDQPSWDLRLETTTGEAMMHVEKDHVPNAEDHYWGGATWRRQKAGRELFYRYPDAPAQPDDPGPPIPAGTYYVAVGAEGVVDPDTPSVIGTGTSTFTLTSRGPLDVQTAPAPITTTPVVFDGESLVYGEHRAYRFTVPDGEPAVEVRFVDKTGDPRMVVMRGGAATDFPYAYQSTTYDAAVGGFYRDNVYAATDVTIALPSGDYTVLVSAQGTPDEAGEHSATYDLRLQIVDPTLAFNDGRDEVEQQPGNTWRYWKVDVPAGTLGWDLRLESTSGAPRMVIRKDLVPNPNNGFQSSYAITSRRAWATEETWAPASELSGRYFGPYNPSGGSPSFYGQSVNMGLGSPLSPGRYYVGVSNGQDDVDMSYTIVSRGIGIGDASPGVPWKIQVADLPFGGEATASGLAVREHRYYRVQVPEGLESWQVELEPTLGEAMMAIGDGALPNAEAGTWGANSRDYAHGARRQKPGNEHFYKLPRHNGGEDKARGGTFYIAVAAEGQNVQQDGYVGTGTTSFKLKVSGPVPIAGGIDRVIESTPSTFANQSAAYGQTKFYRFRIPQTVAAFEVRLAGIVGRPSFDVVPAPALEAVMPAATAGSFATYQPTEDGLYDTAGELAEDIVGRRGDITVAVLGTDPSSDNRFDLVITPKAIGDLAWSGGEADVDLAKNEYAYYKVIVPADCDGVAQAGWIVQQLGSLGSVSIEVRKDTLPGDPAGTWPELVTEANETIIVPPYLQPGIWYVAVRGKVSADAVIRTKEVVEARHWTMPAVGDTDDRPGLVYPVFADTGVSDTGQPIINPGSGDQGTDLEKGRFVFYRLTVPEDNAGLLRTKLTAISGETDLYIRKGVAPTINNMPYPYNQDVVDYRDDQLDGSTFGHWVTPDTRYGTRLEPGEWWLAVHAPDSSARFRLSLDLGDIRELAIDASTGPQVLLKGDMRYFKVAVPDTVVGGGQGTPRDWTLRFTETNGDAVVFLREAVPPGLTQLVVDPETLVNYGWMADWNDDRDANRYCDPGAPSCPALPHIEDTNVADPLVLSSPLTRPNTTYWLGVYARRDSNFTLASSVSAQKVALDGELDWASGHLQTTLPGNARRLYRIDVPPDATLYEHVATNVAEDVELYLGAGLIPPETSYAEWTATGTAPRSLERPLSRDPSAYAYAFPWLAGQSYYLLVVNTSDASRPVDITFEGELYTADTDGDGVWDGWEYEYFYGLTSDLSYDHDQDLLASYDEYVAETDPRDVDTDDDALIDGLEAIAGGQPTDPDTDDDDVCDGADSAPDLGGEAGEVIRLYMHQYDGGTYGKNHGTNVHLTRLVAVFQTYSEHETHWIHVKGFDLEAAGEVVASLNGKPLGVLNVGPNDDYGTPLMISVRRDQLLPYGFDNRFELRRAANGETSGTWGVRELGLMTFGDTFGADPARAFDNRHPGGFDLRVVEADPPDRLIELRGYDLEAAGDIAVKVNGAAWLDALATSANDAWTLPLQVPLAAVDVGATTPRTLAVRPSGDGTWQLRLVAQRPIPTTLGATGDPGEDSHLKDAFEFLYPVHAERRELVTQYDVSEGSEVAIDDSARGQSTYVPETYYGPNQAYFSEASQDRVSARHVPPAAPTSSPAFSTYVRYYGPCADVDNNGALDCEEVCDDADGDGAYAVSALCPLGDDCDDDDPDVGASDGDGDCDGVVDGEDCAPADPAAPANDADCDGVATSVDCDDSDTSTPANDLDCDDVVNAEDCAPTDPTRPSNDADCDGVATNVDCDDADPSQPSNDQDCDGSATSDDCDDDDPSVQGDECEEPPEEPDPCVDGDGDGHDRPSSACASGDDCDDALASSTWRAVDADCDGVQTAVDCDDTSAGVTATRVGDADCDRIPTDVDCNDASAAVTTTNVGDKDCDGVGVAVDCNDNNAAVKNTTTNDKDCDLVLAGVDCNDNSAAVKNTNVADRDCDLVPVATDCDDLDPLVRNTNTNDGDCDLVARAVDCDDADPTERRTRQGDADCDGVPTGTDCDDGDASVTHVSTGDLDCDLVPSASDCNDNNAAVTNTSTNDADCDRVPSDVDCNDHSAAVKTTNVGDADCDGVAAAIDCDDADPAVRTTNVGDADCDGVALAIDCDDTDPAVRTTNVGDADCDGVPTTSDCDDTNAAVRTTSVGDADCDGVATAVDCDDGDASIRTTNADDGDCDGVATALDCDDGDASIRTTNAGDKDCDGVATALDCDDSDARVTATREVNDGDCDGVSDPLDCAPDDPRDARPRAGDNDCDGVASALDCDDRDPRDTGLNTGDLDCDGVASALDCDDHDRARGMRSADDQDCDGSVVGDDCDDTDPTVQACPVCVDGDGDGRALRSPTCPKGDDCDDADGASTWRAVDADCDGVRTADDCDDADDDATVVAEDADCDGVATADDCDDDDDRYLARAADPDCDGVVNRDNCPAVANPDQADADLDGTGDACEPCALGDDRDGDGVVDACDVCEGIPDLDQADGDGDGIGDACDESDGDGVVDGDDNCPAVANVDQRDGDGDGVGDACDPFDTSSSAESSGCASGTFGSGLALALACLVALALARSCSRRRRPTP